MTEDRVSKLEARQEGTDRSISEIKESIDNLTVLVRQALTATASSGKVGWQMVIAAMTLMATIAVIVATLNGAFVLLANGPQWERIYAAEESTELGREFDKFALDILIELKEEQAYQRGLRDANGS